MDSQTQWNSLTSYCIKSNAMKAYCIKSYCIQSNAMSSVAPAPSSKASSHTKLFFKTFSSLVKTLRFAYVLGTLAVVEIQFLSFREVNPHKNSKIAGAVGESVVESVVTQKLIFSNVFAVRENVVFCLCFGHVEHL